MNIPHQDIKAFLDEKVVLYNHPRFIESDPIQIPHTYSLKEDIEIAGFLTATIAWGNRKMIIKNAQKMMCLMGNSPYDFVMSSSKTQQERLSTFVHRTFNGEDFIIFIKNLQHLFCHHGGLEAIFTAYQEKDSMQGAISKFKTFFFENQENIRSYKHVSDPVKGSAAKRINMFLRWMVRKDIAGVDFGLWKDIPMHKLSCPLDVHSGNVARKLGLLERKQNDAKALITLDQSLRNLDPVDPVKYDFALFGLGVFEGF
jgi:uncharacterized protein (TIGR02757 family)